jgi:chromatin segregation and condensation protein Rec8/ScpA/Scc1 (kleisin family)
MNTSKASVSMGIADLPLEELVGLTWEGTLRRLTADMDPWDIDISLLARRYRDYLAALEELSFEIPGRMVLTCSILLRMKSDLLIELGRPVGQDGLVDELALAVEDEVPWHEPADPDAFSLPLLRRPRRRVTLEELRTALSGAMKVSRRRAERLIAHVERDDEEIFEQFEIGGQGIADRLRSLAERIRKLLARSRVVSFFRLLDRGDREERVERFFEILHLAAEGEITCTQDEFLGDILIRLGEPG